MSNQKKNSNKAGDISVFESSVVSSISVGLTYGLVSFIGPDVTSTTLLFASLVFGPPAGIALFKFISKKSWGKVEHG